MKISTKTVLLIPIVAFMTTGCAQQNVKSLYNYGNYNKSYYNFKKNKGEESALELQKVIEETIKNTKEGASGRVPPGMYANLGYIYLKNGKASEAIDNFTKEKTTYPESTHFMDRMIKKVQLAEGVKK